VDLPGFVDSIVSFAQDHTVIAIVLALALLFFMYRKPKLFFGMLFLGLFLAALFYMIMSIAGPGSEQKKRMIPEVEKQSDNNRRSLPHQVLLMPGRFPTGSVLS